MTIIKIESNPNGAHANQTINYLSKVPDDWAVVPEGMETPNFPFGNIEVEEIEGIMTVTKWTPNDIPEPVAMEKPVSPIEQLRADIDFVAVMTGVEL